MGTTPLSWCDENGAIDRLVELDPRTWKLFYDDFSHDLREGILISLRKRNLPDYYVDDVEHQTWIRSMLLIEEKFQDKTTPCKVKFFVRVIGMNLTQELMYALRREGQHEVSLDNSSEETFVIIHQVFESSPEDSLIMGQDTIERERQCALMKKALVHLPEKQRKVVLDWADGKKTSEIAAELVITRDAVNKILQRSFATLRSYMAISDGRGNE